jgi:hypothetical protein
MQPLLGPNSLLLAQTSAQPKLRESRALVYDAWGPPFIHPRLTSPAYLGRADRRALSGSPSRIARPLCHRRSGPGCQRISSSLR